MSYAVIMRRYFYRDRHCRWMPIRSTNPPFDIIEFETFSSAKEFIDEEGAISKRRFDPGKQLLNVLSHGEYAIPSYKIINFDAAQKIVSMEPLIDGSDIDWSGCACETNSSSHCGNCDACDTHFSEGVSDIINKKYIEAIKAIEAIELTKEIEHIIKQMGLNCSVEGFRDSMQPYHWYDISEYCYGLSEAFIREFEDNISWYHVSNFQRFSESFIREFQHKVDWSFISIYNKLSEDFIREMHDKVCWIYISMFQDLSESFIMEFQHKVHWASIARHQQLSESFIREFSRKMNMELVMEAQNLSPEFVLNFSQIANRQDPINMSIYNKSHRVLTYAEKLEEVKKYCEEYRLELDLNNKCFYAYRYHDKMKSGMFNKTISYEKGKYYRDWHLDMNGDNENSFGLGIFPKGNTRVKVLIEDWGVQVSRSSFDRRDGKCRVWGFEIV